MDSLFWIGDAVPLRWLVCLWHASQVRVVSYIMSFCPVLLMLRCACACMRVIMASVTKHPVRIRGCISYEDTCGSGPVPLYACGKKTHALAPHARHKRNMACNSWSAFCWIIQILLSLWLWTTFDLVHHSHGKDLGGI